VRRFIALLPTYGRKFRPPVHFSQRWPSSLPVPQTPNRFGLALLSRSFVRNPTQNIIHLFAYSAGFPWVCAALRRGTSLLLHLDSFLSYFPPFNSVCPQAGDDKFQSFSPPDTAPYFRFCEHRPVRFGLFFKDALTLHRNRYVCQYFVEARRTFPPRSPFRPREFLLFCVPHLSEIFAKATFVTRPSPLRCSSLDLK